MKKTDSKRTPAAATSTQTNPMHEENLETVQIYQILPWNEKSSEVKSKTFDLMCFFMRVFQYNALLGE